MRHAVAEFVLSGVALIIPVAAQWRGVIKCVLRASGELADGPCCPRTTVVSIHRIEPRLYPIETRLCPRIERRTRRIEKIERVLASKVASKVDDIDIRHRHRIDTIDRIATSKTKPRKALILVIPSSRTSTETNDKVGLETKGLAKERDGRTVPHPSIATWRSYPSETATRRRSHTCIATPSSTK